MDEEIVQQNPSEKCFLCGRGTSSDQKIRRATKNNYRRFGIAVVDCVEAEGSTVCLKCWISKMVQNRETKKCPIESCSTSKIGIQSQSLCSLPLNNINDEVKQEVMNRFQVHGDEKVCRKCRTRITAFIRNKEKELSIKMQLSSDTCTTSPSKTLASHGRPRVNYTNASRATKKRMKATAKTLVKTVVDQCNEISKGDGWKLLQEVTVKTPVQHTVKTPSQEDCQNKISQVMDGLSQTYQKEAHSSSGKIRVLSTLAPHFKNKELKKAIPCSDYELTEVCKHAQQHGPGATANKPKQVRRFRIPLEDLASLSILSTTLIIRADLLIEWLIAKGKDHPGSQTCSTKNNNL